MSDPARLGNRALATYGFMALPLAFAGLPIYLHAPDFYATTLGESLTALGLLLLGLRIVDALQDPLIGGLSDRYHHHRGTIIVLGSALLGIGFWMIFHPWRTSPLLWFGIAIFVCTTGFSIVSINLQALGGIWRAGTDDRTRITSWREAFGLIGLLCAAIGPALLGQAENPASAFDKLTLLYIPLLAIGTWLLLRWMRSAPLTPPALGTDMSGWREMFSDSWMRRFFSLYLFNALASSIPAVLVLFFIRDRLNAESLAGVFLLIYFLSGALSMVIWNRLASIMGKPRAWSLSMALAILTFVWAALLGTGDIYAYGAVCVLSGLALGADLAIPPSILADHIDLKRKQDKASRIFSLMTLLSKLALALATGLALPLLGLAGYQPGAPMTATLGVTLSLAYAVLPSFLKAIVLVWLLLDEKRIAQNPKIGSHSEQLPI